MLSLIVVLFLVTFVAYNLNHWRSIRGYDTTTSSSVAAAWSETRNSPPGVRRRSWISQDAQPFVSF